MTASPHPYIPYIDIECVFDVARSKTQSKTNHPAAAMGEAQYRGTADADASGLARAVPISAAAVAAQPRAAAAGIPRKHYPAAKDWEPRRHIIERLYLEEQMTLDQLMGVMASSYGFHAT